MAAAIVSGQQTVVLQDRSLAEEAERGERRAAGERIARITMRVQERDPACEIAVERAVDLIGGQNRAERQIAAREPLRQAQEIRADSGLFAREHRSGPAETHRHLVGDEMDPNLIAGRAQAFQVNRVVHAHPARALHEGLDDDRAHLVGMAFQETRQGLEPARTVRTPALARLAMVAIRRGRADDVHEQRAIAFAVQREVGHRQRPEGLAVVGVFEGDEAGLAGFPPIPPVMEAHLERHLDGGRTVIGVETTCEAFFILWFGRAHLDQALGERDGRLMGEPGEQNVLKVLRLPAHRGADGGMGMAEEVHPPRADGVEVTAPVLVFEPDAMGTADGDRRQPFVVLHLRAGVPQDRPITLAEVHTPWG